MTVPYRSTHRSDARGVVAGFGAVLRRRARLVTPPPPQRGCGVARRRVSALLAAVLVASTVALVGHDAPQAQAQTQADGLPGTPGPASVELVARGNLVDSSSSQQNKVAETHIEDPIAVDVYEHDGKRFAMVIGANEGAHLIDITDVDNIDPMPQPSTNAGLLESRHQTGIDSWLANDGNRYFAGSWSQSHALQIYALRDDGVLWSRWNSAEREYVIDTTRLNGASDVFVYTLQDGVCTVSAGCEVFPGVKVSQGKPIYKNYAVLSAFDANSVHIYEVTDPTALCECDSGAPQTALLRGSVSDSSSLELAGARRLEYYRQADKHYALVTSETDDGIQIIDITDPTNPVARDYLSDSGSLFLGVDDGSEVSDDVSLVSSVYSVAGRTYAVVASTDEDGLQIVDITDPADIRAAGQLANSGSLRLASPRGVSVTAIGDRRYAVASSVTEDGVQVVDVTDPNRPFSAASIAHGSGVLLDGAFAVDTFSDGDRHYAIVTGVTSDSVQILEIKVGPPSSGAFDPSFGDGGSVSVAFGQSVGEVFDVVVQPDGKVVAVGFAENVNRHGNDLVASRDFALARYHPDGSLDTSFGVGGRVLTNFTVPASHRGGDDEARAVALQSDGKIVVAGYAAHPHAGNEFVVARYNANGSLDTGFGTVYSGARRGFAIHSFGALNDVANAVVVQELGTGAQKREHVLIAGQAGNSFGLVRYNSVGDLDGGFGAILSPTTRSGVATVNFGSLADGATSLAVDSNNHIVAGGFRTNNNGTTDNTADDHRDFALVRLSTAGDPDNGFGVSGKVTSDFATGSVEQINDIAIQSNGKIVAVGYSGANLAVARYNTGGALDGEFGDAKGGGETGRQGRALGKLGSAVAKLAKVQIQADGKITAAGHISAAGEADQSILVRFSSAGVEENTVRSNFSRDFIDIDNADRMESVALLPDGEMVLGGFINTGSVNEFALVGADADGSLNTDFGSDGVVITSFGSQATASAMAVQADNKIVVAGYVNNHNATPATPGDDHNDFAVARFNANGTIDTGFGTRGWVTTDIATGSDDRAHAVAVDSAGRIVVAGSSSSDGTDARKNFTVVRYTSSGSLDTGFDTDGKAIVDFAGGETLAEPVYKPDEAFSVLVQPDNKIIAAGYSAHDATGDFAVVRLGTDGALDGDESRRFQGFQVGDDRGYAAAFAPDNKFIVAGTARVDNGTQDSTADDHDDFGVIRINTAGLTLDSTIDTRKPGTQPGTTIIVPTTVDFNSTDDHAHALAVDANGKVVMAGHTTNDNDTPTNTSDDYTEFALARLNTNGTLDTGFNTTGKAITSFGVGGDDEITAIDIDSKGRIVAVGSASHANSNSDFALARYNPDGTADTDFGVGGKATSDFGSTDDAAADIAFASGGEILVAGTSAGEFRVARYIAKSPPSNVSTLGGLALSTSTNGTTFAGSATLAPMFASDTNSYTTTLRSNVTHIKVTPTTTNTNATVTVNSTAVTSGTASTAIALTAAATTTVRVVVTAEDGTTTNTYTVDVKRQSGNAALSGLELTSSSDPTATTFTTTALSRADGSSGGFTSTETSYTANPTETQTLVKLRPTLADNTATVTVNGATVASGTDSAAITVSLGATTTINIVVTAEDTQITPRTYTVAVTPLVDGPNKITLRTVPNRTVREGRGPVTVTATLDDPSTGAASDPATSDVTVTLNIDAASTAVATTDYTLPNPFTIPIPTGSATGAATITLAADDKLAKDDRTLIITGTAGTGRNVTPATITITDDDTAEITAQVTKPRAQGSTLGLGTQGDGEYTLALGSQPTAQVVITATSNDTDKATVRTVNTIQQRTLTFTTQNWQTPQTVFVTRIEDTTTINHTITTTDTTYNALTPPTITVTAPPPPQPTFTGGVVGGGGPVGGDGGGQNEPPSFTDTAVTLTVAENTPPGTNIGDPITATDPDNDEIRYTLQGDDAELFNINPRTGQISVGDNTQLDYETQPNTHQLQVTATDPDGTNTNTTINITINITNINLPNTTATYDTDNNEQITLNELLAAIKDYIARRITRDELIPIIQTYLTT